MHAGSGGEAVGVVSLGDVAGFEAAAISIVRE